MVGQPGPEQHGRVNRPSSAKEALYASEMCDIHRDATVSANIGYFERYHTTTYPTQPDHIRLTIN